MRRRILLVGSLLLALGLAIFGWKTLLLRLPLLPTNPEGLWRVELEVDVRGRGGRGSVRAALPSTRPGQAVSDEYVLSDRLDFTIRSEDEQRTALWSGELRGVHRLSQVFRVQLRPQRVELPAAAASSPVPATLTPYLGPSSDLPSDALEIERVLKALNLGEAFDVIGRVRAIFAFVTDEVSEVEAESKDALLTLAAREGDYEGKARLLATLLRADAVPARIVQGIELREDEPRHQVWVEAWLNDAWVPMSPSLGVLGERPDDWLALRIGASDLVRGTGIGALSSRYRAVRQFLSPGELSAIMRPPNSMLAALSLYRLPLETQSALRLLLVIPLGALVMALMRNVVGVPAFGTFLPVLVALALRETTLLPGILILSSVVGLGVLGRVLIDRLHLLLVPRLCILLCVVILSLALVAVLGRNIENQDLFGGVLLPIVILSMLIERFSITVAEEGWRDALGRLGWTGAIAILIYPIFRNETIQQVLLGFPELTFCVMGLLIFVGGYTGYRLFELWRFRSFAYAVEPPPR